MNLVKRLVTVLIALIAVAVWTQIPERRLPDLGVGPDRVPSSTAACPVVTGRDAGSTALVGSRLAGDGLFEISTGGAVQTESQTTIAELGGSSFDVGAAIGSATVSMIVDLPEDGAAAAIVTESDVVLAAAACTPPADGETAIAGVSTASGESLDLVLANPYANDAVVEVRTVSEAGADSASELESVVVPARSVVAIDLVQLLPLRTRLSIRIIPERGVVHAAAVQSSADERMVVEAVQPAVEWLLPVPDTGTPPTITVFPTSGVDTRYVIDAYTETGPIEGAVEGTIGPDAQLEIDVEALPEGTAAIRVATTADSVTSVVVEGETIRAGTPGAPGAATTWIAPGPVGDGAVLRLANPTGLAASVQIRPLVTGAAAQALDLQAGATAIVRVSGPGAGYIVQSDSEVFVAWSLSTDAGFALGVGSATLEAGE